MASGESQGAPVPESWKNLAGAERNRETVSPPRRGGYRLNLLLFLLTFFTTLLAGALQQGINPLSEPARIGAGAPFAITLMLILLTHELGHYLASRYHGVDASLPYFIPAPNIFGTFGAIIKMRSRLRSRRTLIDIGMTGPLAGFVLSVPAIIIGYRLSEVVGSEQLKEGLYLGNSLLMAGMEKILIGEIPWGQEIILHPIGFAGWLGLFVTSLNLIPYGQLDGGHIVYALGGRRFHRFLSLFLLPVLILMGLLGSWLWYVWAVLLIVITPNHPPVEDPADLLSPGRRVLGGLTMVIFILTFIPVPIQVI